MVAHLKYASDEDLKQIGLSKPEIRRLRKFYEKYFPHGYLSKIKRLLQNPTKKDEIAVSGTRLIRSDSHFILLTSTSLTHTPFSFGADDEYNVIDGDAENDQLT